MQHDHVLKKLNFDLWFKHILLPNIYSPGPGEVGGGCGQNICYHFAAFVIPLNLTCNITMF